MRENSRTLRVSTAAGDGGPIVQAAGEVDLHTSPELRARLIEILATKPRRVIVDLAHVGYMDSSGVGTLVEIKRMLERDGAQVVLAGLQPRVRAVFEISQLDKFFRIVGSVAEVGPP